MHNIYKLYILGPLGIILFLTVVFLFLKIKEKHRKINILSSILVIFLLSIGIFWVPKPSTEPLFKACFEIFMLYFLVWPIFAFIIDIIFNKKQTKFYKIKKYFIYTTLWATIIFIIVPYVGENLMRYDSNKCDRLLSIQGKYCKFIPSSYKKY